MNRSLYRRLHGFLLLVILVASTFSATPVTQASESDPPEIDKPRRGFDAMPEYLDPPPAPAAAEQVQAPSDAPAWGYVAFQSYRNGNWEIYNKNQADHSENRLTQNPGYDGEPRLSPLGNQIAYTAEFAGRKYISVIGVDGSGGRALTGVRKDEITPAYSPDGTRIVFSREDQRDWDLFIIQTDGKNEIPLFFDPETIDVYPTWSPDGKKIAFVRIDKLGYSTMWIINIDGSGLQQLSVPMPYIQTPRWSPDGKMLSFDADMDWDGWNELGLINADGSNMRIIQDESKYKIDLWNGGWASAGNKMMYTRLSYIVYEGKYYLKHLSIGIIQLGLAGNVWVPMGNYEANPDYVSMDKKPPSLWVAPIPEYSQQNYVDWEAIDHDSGYSSIFVEKREGEAGSWITYQPHHNEQNDIFIGGKGGKQYYYRFFVSDRAGNLSSVTTPIKVTFYNYKISGRVLDNRGRAVPEASILVQPEPLKVEGSGPSGEYSVYLVDQGQYSVQGAAVGYEPLNPMLFNVDKNLTTDLYLKPTDDQVVNGSFEAAPESLAGWTATDLVKTQAKYPPSDQKTVYLGYNCPNGNCIEATYVVSKPTADSNFYFFEADHLGRIHNLNWDPNSLKFWHRIRTRDGSWTEPTYLQGMPGSNQDIFGEPQLIVDPNNNLYFIVSLPADLNDVRDYPILLYKYTHKTGQWSAPERITRGGNPRILLDKKGRLILSFTSPTADDIFYMMIRSNAGVWSDPMEVGKYARSTRELFVDLNNTIHIFYEGYSRIWHRSWSDTKGFSEIVQLPTTDGMSEVWVDYTNKLYVYTYEDYYLTLLPDGSWTAVTDTNLPKETKQVEIDGMGNVYIFYQTPVTTYSHDKHNYILTRFGGRWTEPQKISTNDFTTHWLIANPDVGFHIFETETYPPEFKHYKGYYPPPTTEYRLEQEVTIPGDLNRPTLNFWYELSWGEAANPSRLVVEVDDQGTVTELFSTTSVTSGEIVWFDMQPWAGKTVTLRAYLERSSGVPLRYAHLDDISIGSWISPVATDVSQRVVELDVAETELVLEGDNLMPGLTILVGGLPATNIQWLSSTSVQFTLPAGLSAGAHRIKVTNPSGVSSYMPGSLQVGDVVLIPGIRR